MVQRETGLEQDEIYDIFRFDEKKADEIREILNEKYKYVHFCFRSGQTIEELDETIVTTEDKIGRKIKLIIPDYSELISTGISDPTASSAQVAQRLRQISNEREVCNLVLLQPSKNFSSPGDEITNYNAAKGSSSIVQSLTLLLGCSRPGFNPLEPEMDKFFNITCLKNRNGPLFSVDLSWEGLRGMISTLTDEQREELKEIRNQRAQQKADQGGF
jgi:replicative DNA helicase